MLAKYKYHAKCKQCGLGFRDNLQSRLLRRLSKHLWRKHRDYMIRKIKAGLRKRKNTMVGNPIPQWLQLALGGVFPPLAIPTIAESYKKMSKTERQVVKQVVRSGSGSLAGVQGRALGEAILQALDRYAGEAVNSG